MNPVYILCLFYEIGGTVLYRTLTLGKSVHCIQRGQGVSFAMIKVFSLLSPSRCVKISFPRTLVCCGTPILFGENWIGNIFELCTYLYIYIYSHSIFKASDLDIKIK